MGTIPIFLIYIIRRGLIYQARTFKLWLPAKDAGSNKQGGINLRDNLYFKTHF